jgi:hypothetical protein
MRLGELAQNAEKKATVQKEAFLKFHQERVTRLKKEVLVRIKQIKVLREELKSIKERPKAEDIAKDIRVLESERDALTAEMDKEETLDEKSVPRPDTGIEEIYKLKDTITKLTVENSRLQSLNKEYMKRYNDVLNFGNKIKLENRELQQQIQDLLMKSKTAKAE